MKSFVPLLALAASSMAAFVDPSKVGHGKAYKLHDEKNNTLVLNVCDNHVLCTANTGEVQIASVLVKKPKSNNTFVFPDGIPKANSSAGAFVALLSTPHHPLGVASNAVRFTSQAGSKEKALKVERSANNLGVVFKTTDGGYLGVHEGGKAGDPVVRVDNPFVWKLVEDNVVGAQKSTVITTVTVAASGSASGSASGLASGSATNSVSAITSTITGSGANFACGKKPFPDCPSSALSVQGGTAAHSSSSHWRHAKPSGSWSWAYGSATSKAGHHSVHRSQSSSGQHRATTTASTGSAFSTSASFSRSASSSFSHSASSSASAPTNTENVGGEFRALIMSGVLGSASQALSSATQQVAAAATSAVASHIIYPAERFACGGKNMLPCPSEPLKGENFLNSLRKGTKSFESTIELPSATFNV